MEITWQRHTLLLKSKLFMRKYNAIAHGGWWISLKDCVHVGFLPNKSFRGKAKMGLS